MAEGLAEAEEATHPGTEGGDPAGGQAAEEGRGGGGGKVPGKGKEVGGDA